MKILIPIFLLLSIALHAQHDFSSVNGKLVDENTKEPIAYASVYLKGKSIGTITNSEGSFLFHLPSTLTSDTLVISAIGYDPFRAVVRSAIGKDNLITLSPSAVQLSEVVVKGEKELSAKEIVKKAVAGIPQNYPMTPFVIEGFFRDLQKENDKPVELLEAALRFKYQDYNPGFEDVEIIEVRRNHNKRHPVNGTYDRQNAIFDLMEDNYVKHRFGPIGVKGWRFAIDSILTYDRRTVYQISGRSSESESAVMYVDSDDFAILKLELKEEMVNGEYYRRYLNLPDPYGLQETSFTMIFEFQEIDDKMYLKYQREEDTYNLFIKATNEIILKQAFVKELFVNNVVKDKIENVSGQRMNINQSLEGQARSFNADFWKYYNAPVETSKDSKIIKELQDLEFSTTK